MLVWSIGFLTGFLLFLATAALFLFKLILYPKLQKKLPEFIKPKALSESIINEIESNLSSSNNEETALWLNAIINWSFLNLFDSPAAQTVLHQLISEIAVDLRRSPLGHFITNSELKTIQISGTAPRVESARIITGSTLKDPSSSVPLTIKFDLEYDGFCRVLTSFDAIFDLKISNEVLIKSFKGSFIVVIQDKTVHFCFYSEPEILDFDTKTFFSSDQNLFYQVPLLNRLVSSRLVRKVIRFTSAFPNFSGKWYRAGPEQPPYPWYPSVKNNPELLFTWTPKLD